MRIISGRAKGQRLFCPGGLDIRPPLDRMKESFFDVFQFHVEGCHFLDLFAGTGSMGLEALSRGAKRVVFVEKAPKALSALRNNLRLCGFAAKDGHVRRAVPAEGLAPELFEIVDDDVFSTLALLESRRESFNLIFLDPPFRFEKSEDLLALLGRGTLSKPEGAAVLHHHKKKTLAESYGHLASQRQKHYGQSCLTFFGTASEKV